ncbi:hypothetical protein CKK34_2288 [Yarrowia sp. E02]|nr:hypothetical protein CKK34_2288 [Yarrowia sp. E02]
MSTTIASPMSTPTTQDPGPANNPFRHLQTYSQLPRHMISPSLDKFSDSSSSYWGSRRSTGTKEPAGLVPEVPQNVVDDELQILGAQVLRDAVDQRFFYGRFAVQETPRTQLARFLQKRVP